MGVSQYSAAEIGTFHPNDSRSRTGDLEVGGGEVCAEFAILPRLSQ